MDNVLEPIFMWPSLPAAIMVFLACVYWLLVIAGAVSIDLLHIDFHNDVDGSLLDLGFAPLGVPEYRACPVDAVDESLLVLGTRVLSGCGDVF